jgi:Uma2 family endonuclease
MIGVVIQPADRVRLGGFRIPGWVVDLESFHRWVDSPEFPEEGRIDYLKGEVWVDMSEEQVFTHNQAKQEFNLVLGGLVKSGHLGRYFPDGLRLSNIAVELSAVPDGTFISNENFRELGVRLIEGAKEGYTCVDGAPDMVLEIISESSVQKDSRDLPRVYWEAGVKEYWLVDVRGERLRFDVFRHAATGYVAARKRDGWVKSAVFGRSFRLTRQADEFGHPEYTLDVR